MKQIIATYFRAISFQSNNKEPVPLFSKHDIRAPGRPKTNALLMAIAFAGFFAIWQIVSSWVHYKSPEVAIFVPGPSKTFGAGLDMVQTSSFWGAFLTSNLRVLIGFTFASLVGVPLGLFLGAFPRYRGFAGPAVDFARYIPVAAIIPLAILWVGTGENAKIMILFLGTVFQIIVLTADAIRRVPIEFIESALALGANTRTVLVGVLARAAAPRIFDGLRVAIGLTWGYLTMAEIVAAERGLGFIIIYSQRFLRVPQIFFVVIVLGILGLLYDRLFVAARPRLFPWDSSELQPRAEQSPAIPNLAK